jgi:hypothetical protein
MRSEREGRASAWQKRIEGDWHGVPSVFDAAGNHVGHIKVSRASTFADGRTTYTMSTDSEVVGPLRARFEAKDFAFGVRDGDEDRVYLGPDFFGAGQPTGALVDAHYYSPAWAADLRTMVHVLPDGKTQAYSSQLFEGPALVAVFNGLYRSGSGYGEDAAVTTEIEGFLAGERKAGGASHVLPFKRAGRWVGELTAHGARREPEGRVSVRIDYRPLTLLRAAIGVRIEGPFTRHVRYERTRVGNRHTFDGPDVWGNAIGYGRALYTSQHFHGEGLTLTGREFLLDDRYTLAVTWHVRAGGELRHVLFGVLQWEPGEEVLGACQA